MQELASYGLLSVSTVMFGFMFFFKDLFRKNYASDLRAVLEYIDVHLTEELKVSDLAGVFYISQSTLERRFREHLGCAPAEFIRKKRLMLAAALLREGDSVLQVGLESGFPDNSYFISLFRRYCGVTPLQYQKMSRDRA